MIPQRWIEAYLRFLLKFRGSVTIAVTLMTLFFAYHLAGMRLHTDFFDFYPKFRTFADALAACREAGGGLPSCVTSETASQRLRGPSASWRAICCATK